MKNFSRHIWIYQFFRQPVKLFLKLRFGYTGAKEKPLPSPSIILANHTTNYDPLMVAASYRAHMYFVAGEHVFRTGFAGRLLRACFAPIARVKGTTDARTVMEVLKCVHAGRNVCIFAEGDRSFNGLTCDILPSTGKLVRASGAALVTYRIEGGYFASPRWSRTLRRGKVYGHEVARYSPEELKDMTNDEVNAIIKRDLYEDAYARQSVEHTRFTGKRLAEGIEAGLYLCPSCKRVQTITGKGDRFACSCGLHGRYTEYGMLEGDALPFSTVTQWDLWQTETFFQRAAAASNDEPLFEDAGQRFFRLRPDEQLLEEGTLRMYGGRFMIGDHSVKLSDIVNLAIHGRMTIVFSTHDGQYYELRSLIDRSAPKYEVAWRACLERGRAANT
ncbi:MAG TPA: lysophospholipid acyltransferase family protein [Feifaniaceae bacterium]|nr:lysophospholipid acyltransferase family protein [Feifaniaceae bacterium]